MAYKEDMNRFVLAARLAQEAGDLILRYARRGFSARKKIGGSLVTDADVASERHILKNIQKYFPDDGIVAEESGFRKGTNAYVWHIDPLDGTTNFTKRIPYYAVSIGIVKTGRAPVVLGGAISVPELGELYTAQRKQGAYRNGKKISVSRTTKEKDAIALLASPRFAEAIASLDLPLMKIAKKFGKIRVFGSTAANLCFLASGRADIGFFVDQYSWDVVAGMLIVEEAGGRVTDFAGKPFLLDTSATMAVSNSRLKTNL